ncbi:MAG: flagellar biosynthesis protein FlhB [Brevinema sp.]
MNEDLILILSIDISNFNFDLQRFAAEDEGRTELPSERKKQRAREEGNIPMSPELSGIVIFLSVFFGIVFLWRYLFNHLLEMIRYYIANIDNISVSKNNIQAGFWDTIYHIVAVLGPILAIAVVSTLIISLIQTRFLFTTKKLAFNLEKVFGSIFKNLQKMFWSSQALFNLGKSLLKVIAVFGIAGAFALNALPSMIAYTRMDAQTSFGMVAGLLVRFVAMTGILLLIFAIADYIFQQREHTEQLKMTKKELRDELKEDEGDPAIKAKIRQLESQLGMRRMMAAVPTADVIITNPTHYAVAIKYDRAIGSAPIVVAKGKDRTALRIRELAKENQVPIIENKPLARGLFATANVGEEIPYEYWEVVANILSLVYASSGKTRTVHEEAIRYI